MSFILSVSSKSFMLSVVMLNVVALLSFKVLCHSLISLMPDTLANFSDQKKFESIRGILTKKEGSVPLTSSLSKLVFLKMLK